MADQAGAVTDITSPKHFSEMERAVSLTDF
jgi:hypothetical protein